MKKQVGYLKATLAYFGLLALVIFPAACASITERGMEQRWESSATAVATVATYEALNERPDWREGFVDAQISLAEIATKETIDFWAVYGIVNRLPVDELKGERAVVYATSANLIFEEFGNPAVPIKDAPGLRGFVRGLAIGIERGLALTESG